MLGTASLQLEIQDSMFKNERKYQILTRESNPMYLNLNEEEINELVELLNTMKEIINEGGAE